MTTDTTTAFDDAAAAAHSPIQSLITSIADRLGQHANARAVFADPVERDGLTVIPVAQVRYGFGGGTGSGSDEHEGAEGGGGGGGMGAKPVGFIEISPAGAEFRPIRNTADLWPIVLAGGFAAFLVLRGLRALFR